MYILQVITSLLLLGQSCYSRNIFTGADLGNEIMFSWELDTLSMKMSVKLPDTFKWIAIGFHGVPFGAKYWEDIAMISIDLEGGSEVSYLKTLHWDDEDTIYESELDLYGWENHGRQKSKHDYYFTIKRNLLDLPKDTPVKLMWAYGTENAYGAYPEIDKFKSAILTLDNPGSLETSLESIHSSTKDEKQVSLNTPGVSDDTEAEIPKDVEENTSDDVVVPPSSSSEGTVPSPTDVPKNSVQNPTDKITVPSLTDAPPTDAPIPSVKVSTDELEVKVNTSPIPSAQPSDISEEYVKPASDVPKDTVKTYEDASEESINTPEDVAKPSVDAFVEPAQPSIPAHTTVPTPASKDSIVVDATEKSEEDASVADKFVKPSVLAPMPDDSQASSKTYDDPKEVDTDDEMEDGKEDEEVLKKVENEKSNHFVGKTENVITHLTEVEKKYEMEDQIPVDQIPDMHGRAKPKAKPKIFSSGELEKCGIDLCSYSRCPKGTICVPNNDYCTSSCKDENEAEIAECSCTKKSESWYSVFKNNENTVYFGVIGFSAFFTGLIVLCLACCCAKKARKLPRTRKSKVSFYKVNDFDSSADEEIEFLKEDAEDAEDEVYTKNN